MSTTVTDLLNLWHGLYVDHLLALVEDDSPLALLTAPLTAPPRTMIPKGIGCRLRKAVLQGRGGSSARLASSGDL